MIRYFFERDLSVAHAVGGAAVTLSAYHQRWGLAALIFAVVTVICVIGEIALERQGTSRRVDR